MTPSGHLRILGEVDQLGEATDDEIFSSIQDELDAAVAGEAGPRAPLRAARRSETMGSISIRTSRTCP